MRTQRAIYRRPRAIHDIIDLAEFVGRQDPAAADRFLDAVAETLCYLTATPGIGSPWEASTGGSPELRWFPVNGFPNHLIFYTDDGTTVEVVRVLHGSRDLQTLLGEERW